MDDNKNNRTQDQNTPADEVSEEKVEVEENQVSEEIEETAESAESAESTDENISEEIEVTEEELEKIEEKTKGHGLPDFRVGDTVKVMYKIIEGDKQRLQPFIGIVISIKGSDVSKTFTVRKIGADNIGVERIFPFYSPNIAELSVVKKGKVRRAKLYYLREKKGRAAMRIKERV